MPADNKRIAKNTVLLYFRMMFMMFVSLFTSRVILKVLGVSDYGIYQTVGGVVGLMTFINGALATGSSRFLTFELGAGNFDKLKKTFSTVVTVHVILGLLIVLIGETVGLWFVYHKLVIPEGRMEAAIFCYHLSILTCLVDITQVPYNASIVSHEKMGIYAYMSIIDVLLKLIIVYLLYISPVDKLESYAVLLGTVSIGMSLFYRWYCVRNFRECKYHFIIDRKILKEVLGYSGWNLFSNTAIALSQQGTTVLINMFFTPGVVAARAIANQVNGVANQFIGNFRMASNPQIVKLYAAENYDGSKMLLLNSTKFSFYLMLLLAMPIFMVARPLLHLWLGQVPPYSVIFLQLAVATSLFQVFDTSFYTALYAKGRIRENALFSPVVSFLAFPIIYLLFKSGSPPETCAWVMMVGYAVLGLLVKPILIIKIVNYTWKDIWSVYEPCLKVVLLSIPLPVVIYIKRNIWLPNSIIQFLILVSVSVLCVIISTWYCGMDKQLRKKTIEMVKKTIKK